MNDELAVCGERRAATAGATLRLTGTIAALDRQDMRLLLDRSTSSDTAVRERAAAIIERVRREGDAALAALAIELDGVKLDALEVPRAARVRALAAMTPDLRRALERAERNIEIVHRASLPQPIESSPEPGIVVGRRADPLGRVGIYAPGGRAAYPSSVLMGAVPARVAGVRELVLCTPPDRTTGRPTDVVLAAAELAGVDRVFALGGAGAVAAMAFGTATVPRVDRIVGPGNAYVAEAKLQLSGIVGIDAPAGPSELLVLADETANATTIAREMIGQAEHDPLACAIAVIFPGCPEATEAAGAIARQVEDAIAALLPAQQRADVIREAFAARGGVLVAACADEALRFAEEYAPEHLLLSARDADALLARVRNAGTVFVGETSSNAFGDYMTGANHVLPTGGLARSFSGLSVLDFVRWTTYQRVDARAAAALSEDVARLADAEGLPGHAAAARAWAGSAGGRP